MEVFPLFDLPRELRDRVYEFVLLNAHDAISLLLINHEVHHEAYAVLAKQHRLVLATVEVAIRDASPLRALLRKFRQNCNASTHKIITTKLCTMHLHLAVPGAPHSPYHERYIPDVPADILPHQRHRDPTTRFSFTLTNMEQLRDFCMRVAIADMTGTPRLALGIRFHHKASKICEQEAYEAEMLGEVKEYFWGMEDAVVYDSVKNDLADDFIEDVVADKWTSEYDIFQELEKWLATGNELRKTEEVGEARACWSWALFLVLATLQKKEWMELIKTNRTIQRRLATWYHNFCLAYARSLLRDAKVAIAGPDKTDNAQLCADFCTEGLERDLVINPGQALRSRTSVALALYLRCEARQLLGQWELADYDCRRGSESDPDAVRAKRKIEESQQAHTDMKLDTALGEARAAVLAIRDRF